jgi:hypothetical protein
MPPKKHHLTWNESRAKMIIKCYEGCTCLPTTYSTCCLFMQVADTAMTCIFSHKNVPDTNKFHRNCYLYLPTHALFLRNIFVLEFWPKVYIIFLHILCWCIQNKVRLHPIVNNNGMGDNLCKAYVSTCVVTQSHPLIYACLGRCQSGGWG